MRQLTIQRVMLVTIFVLLFTLALRIPVDTDTWWHLRSGEYTLKHGFIYEDPFSFTKQGEEWINHSWGSQIIMYGVYELAGNAGLAIFTALLATAGMAVLYTLCTGSVYLRGFVLILGAATAAVFWSARPQMISFFLSTVVLYILYQYKYEKKDRLWWLVPLMMVWGNLHAGFSIGYIFIGGFIAGEFLGHVFQKDTEGLVSLAGLGRLILFTLISVAALVVNPYTYKMLLVPFQTLSIGALRDFIQEWNSPNFQQRQTWPFILMVIYLFGALGGSKKPLGWMNFVLLSGTLFMALTAGRNIAVFAVVATPVLARHLDALLTERGWILRPMQRVTQRQARLNAFLLTLIVLGALANMLTILDPETVDEAQREYLPVQVAEFIEADQPQGPMFNSYNWGGYLMFALPDYPVYADGRTDLYQNDFLMRYIRTVVGQDDWRAVLDEDGINLVVIEPGSGLARNLAEEPGWSEIYPNDEYLDEDHVVFVRDEPLSEDNS